MSIENTLRVFASRFVKKHFEERFVHEALKKPSRLMARVYQRLSDILEDRFRNGTCTLKAEDRCLFFEPTGNVKEMNWAAAMKHVNEYGAGGYLVIGVTGQSFYAQSEGFPPPETYAG